MCWWECLSFPLSRGPVFSAESVTDEDSLAAELRRRETIPWRSFSTYLHSGGLLLLLLFVLSQLAKHTLMVAIDYWLAHWTSSFIVVKLSIAEGNCTSEQVRDWQVTLGSSRDLTLLTFNCSSRTCISLFTGVLQADRATLWTWEQVQGRLSE